ncbi:hypothetical protein BCR42DRAFT_412641 [Absidia repens]|uniref:Uncharacterized protein n=1 Tax=Absidia repens TaxID=90262 RepID=A0A1X2IJV7_9FUNG|nr:hypothetical protein BCR42DRAFT_412641 [Absidia repens]
MVKSSHKKYRTKSLLKDLLKGQKHQQKQLDQQKKILTAIQLQLQQLISNGSSANEGRTTSTINDMNGGRNIASGTASTATVQVSETIPALEPGPTPTPETEGAVTTDIVTDSIDYDGVIPWPRYMNSKRSCRLYVRGIPKDIVVKAVKNHLVRGITIDFNDKQMKAASRSSDDDFAERRALLVWQRIASATKTVCDQEGTPALNVSSHLQLPGGLTTRIIDKVEAALLKDTILIGRAEDHWMAKYFISRYLKNTLTKCRRLGKMDLLPSSDDGQVEQNGQVEPPTEVEQNGQEHSSSSLPGLEQEGQSSWSLLGMVQQ